MLFDQSIPRGMERKICVRTTDSALGAFLNSLLDGWRFSLEEDTADGTLLLAEEGSCDVPPNQPVLWLGHSQYASRDKLPLPMPIEELYLSLEHRFHRPPRRHMRLDIDLPARVDLRGEQHASGLTSLSDRGGRVLLPLELVRDEKLGLEFSLAGHPMNLVASVIYSFQRPGTSSEPAYDTGVLFARQTQGECELLREFILDRYVSRLRDMLDPDVFSAGLSYFTLPQKLSRQYASAWPLN